MEDIRDILAELYRQDISDDEAQKRMEAVGAEAMGEFILGAFDRGWISPFNLGIGIDGKVT